MGGHVDESGIKKGPWSAEEDEVLVDFVRQNGPRDWSSIRSKGLLPRTGKSCRLRWVNKLRPNIKVGCKFTADEERVVVELQARFGNKWAKIATHLQGRTDNDVKNFWSSRQKRLARILQFSSQSKGKCQKQSKQKSALIPQLPPNIPVIDTRSGYLGHTDHISQVPEGNNTMIQVITHPSSDYFPPESSSKHLNAEFINPVQLACSAIDDLPLCPEPLREIPLYDPWFTQCPNPPALSDSLSTLSHTIRLPDHHIKDLEHVFAEPTGCSELFPPMYATNQLHDNVGGINFEVPLFGGLMVGSCSKSCAQRDAVDNLANPDGFFDDFPTDVFDSLDILPGSDSSAPFDGA